MILKEKVWLMGLEEKDTKQISGPTPLGNIITVLVLFTGMQAFRAGNVIDTVANGVLSGVTLVQNGIWGAVVVAYTSSGAAKSCPTKFPAS